MLIRVSVGEISGPMGDFVSHSLVFDYLVLIVFHAPHFIQQKQQEAYSSLVERLMKTKDVQIYENKFK